MPLDVITEEIHRRNDEPNRVSEWVSEWEVSELIIVWWISEERGNAKRDLVSGWASNTSRKSPTHIDWGRLTDGISCTSRKSPTHIDWGRRLTDGIYFESGCLWAGSSLFVSYIPFLLIIILSLIVSLLSLSVFSVSWVTQTLSREKSMNTQTFGWIS